MQSFARCAFFPALIWASSASAQDSYVEVSAALGLQHRFMSGFDRVGDLVHMMDWAQQGIGLGDLDGDGDLDVVLAGRLENNHVYRNDGGTFTDISRYAGIDNPEYEAALALGDYDNDGDLDLFLGHLENGTGPASPSSRLYRNDGSGHFEDVTVLARTGGFGHSIMAKWWDVDRDGLLDLIVAEFCGTPNRLYRNLGEGSFADVSAEMGFEVWGSTHVIGVADLDGDGFDDVQVGNDYFVSSYALFDPNPDDVMLRGLAGGAFEDVSSGSGIPLDGPPSFGASTMGMCFGDVDYDGDLDIYKTESKDNFLMINHGWPASGVPWTQAQDFYGVTNAKVPNIAVPGTLGNSVGWGCGFLDADFDLWLDLFKVNGHVTVGSPRLQQNYLFRGLGPSSSFQFSDQTAEFGLLDNFDDRSLALGDLDSDGDLELLIGPGVGSLRVFENRIDREGQGYLCVTAECKTSAPGGAGVRVSFVDSLGLPHVRVIDADGQTASQNQNLAYFGLGHESSVDVRVEFPSGLVRTYAGVLPNTHLIAQEPEMIRLSGRTLSSVGSSFSGGFVPLVKPTQLLAVKAFACDAQGLALGPAAPVSIEVEGLQAMGAVQSLGGNAFQRLFFIPKTPGEHRVQVAFGDFSPRIEPVVAVLGPADQAVSSLRLQPEAVRAGGPDTFQASFVPRDAGGRSLGSGHAVRARMPAVGDWLTLQDRGDGRYQGDFAAPSLAGEYEFEIEFDGTLLEGLGTLEAASAPSPALSSVYVESPNFLLALATHQLRFQVTPRDANGLRLGSAAQMLIVVKPNAGTDPVTVVSGLGPNAQPDGDYAFVLAKPEGAPEHSAKGQFKVFCEGLLLKTVSYNF